MSPKKRVHCAPGPSLYAKVAAPAPLFKVDLVIHTGLACPSAQAQITESL